MATFNSGTVGILEAEPEALAVPTLEDLLGPDADKHADWLAVDEDVFPAQVVTFDPTLSTAGVTEFFEAKRPDRDRDAATVTSILPIVQPVEPVAATENLSPLRRFVNQFDRFAADFHAFAMECQGHQRP